MPAGVETTAEARIRICCAAYICSGPSVRPTSPSPPPPLPAAALTPALTSARATPAHAAPIAYGRWKAASAAHTEQAARSQCHAVRECLDVPVQPPGQLSRRPAPP
eukprot:365130-Chlamydomonas_euryale.AAC.27